MARFHSYRARRHSPPDVAVPLIHDTHVTHLRYTCTPASNQHPSPFHLLSLQLYGAALKRSGYSVVTRKKCTVNPFTLSVAIWASECPDVKYYKWRVNPVWHRMLYSCTHMATVGVKGLISAAWTSRLSVTSPTPCPQKNMRLHFLQ